MYYIVSNHKSGLEPCNFRIVHKHDRYKLFRAIKLALVCISLPLFEASSLKFNSGQWVLCEPIKTRIYTPKQNSSGLQ